MRRGLWIIYALAAFALVAGPLRFEAIIAWSLPRVQTGGGDLAPASFQPRAVYTTTDCSVLPRGLATYGSWVNGDEFQGRHDTPWYAARPRFLILVAGYPALAPNRLEIEFRRRDASRGTIHFNGENPGEAWRRWEVTLPNDATEFRIRAVDASSVARGWLACSEPFVDVAAIPRKLWPLVQIAATSCLALALLCGPGLVLLRRSASPLAVALAILPGPLLLAVVGLGCWSLGGRMDVATLARGGIALLLIAIGIGLWRTRRTRLPRNLAAVTGASALIAGFAIAKASLSIGPDGELFGGSVSRTLAVGGHSDSRISYHVVQLVAAHAGPFSEAADALYLPWSFANRGPIAGLLAAPIVLATGGRPTADACAQPWHPFDRQGFAAYRIALIVLASLAPWAVFAAVAIISSSAWALLAATILLLSPFFVHELYFTWPKLATAGCVLTAFVLAHHRRPFAAGLAFAAAYLMHPLALLVLPFFALWVLFANRAAARGWRRLVAPTWFTLGVVPVVIGWMAFSQLAPLRTGAQTVFFDYFRLSDNKLITAAGPWWHARWENFANTYIPLHLFTVDRAHESINSVYGASDPWVQASFLYWNTLPFALGLPAFALLVGGIIAATRRAPGTAILTYHAPALLLMFYWGAADTGVMRHCGHVLFVSTIVLGVWGISTAAGSWRPSAVNAFTHPACFAWRGFEVALVAFGTTLLHQRPTWSRPYGTSDLVLLAIAAMCLAASVLLLARASRAGFSEAVHPPD